ncbi:alkaline phosphatase PhoX [Janibacter sp. G56]|uniref:alkaline phosphatase PhoX n=1 Tax=Janibacter sp. G56 TaxID=3418717 RepID=UPI003D084F5C
MKSPLRAGVVAGSVLLTGLVATAGGASADSVRFSDFTPLAASAGPTATEATPITFGNPSLLQRSIVSKQEQLAKGEPNTGVFDMNVVNETGHQPGSFLFTPFESQQSGIQRTDLASGETKTLWISPEPEQFKRWDGSQWTPQNTYVTAEEEWCADAEGCTTNPWGRFFELTNPLTADSVTEVGGEAANVEHRNVIPRMSHEGISFDKKGNMYVIDEFNGGSIFRYTPKASKGEIAAGRAGYFDAGQTSVLRVGDGNTPNATGSYAWVPITDWQGKGLPGTLTITDPNGVTSVDGRNTTDVPAFKGTDYQRPEDVQLKTVNGVERLYVATTTTNEVYVMDLGSQEISVFADASSTDLATGAAAGSKAFTSPDNLAIDSEGNIYIVEDRNGGVDNDIWLAKDLNDDGDLGDAGEGIGRWASNGTVGSEFTGLYFDPTDKRRAWVNIQHPASGNDRTIEITLP